MDNQQIFQQIEEELKRAESKHPSYPRDIFHQLAILQEEAGEVSKAVLEYREINAPLKNVREELIQTAAMCVRMLKNLPTNQQLYFRDLEATTCHSLEYFRDLLEFEGQTIMLYEAIESDDNNSIFCSHFEEVVPKIECTKHFCEACEMKEDQVVCIHTGKLHDFADLKTFVLRQNTLQMVEESDID